MRKFEIWTDKSNSGPGFQPDHILEADSFYFTNGVYYFVDRENTVLHSIMASPGMLVREVK